MRRRSHLALLAALVALLANCKASGSSPEPAAGELASPRAHDVRTAPFDVEHYALDLRIEPRARRIDGTCRVRLWPTGDALEEVALDLADLEVASVHDADGRELAFAHLARGLGDLDGTLRIRLAEPAPPGTPVELAICYGGVPRKGLWFSGEVEGVPTQVFTQGECEDARWWFPCFDEPHDRATSEVRVELPPGWRSVAAGELVERSQLADGRVAERWRMPFPHPTYLETLVAGDLARVEGSWRGVPLAYLAAPRLEERLSSCLEATPRALEVLGELTGVRYPYAKYSQACVDNFPLGGMENVSATTLTVDALTDARGLRDWDPTELVVHEAAHQWFGDLLTCADWSQIWLNEGFATYAEELYRERVDGADAFSLGVRAMQRAYLDADVGASRRATVSNVYVDPMDLFFGGQTYEGGGARLHLLRGVVGDEAFFAGVHAYLTEHAGGPVTTTDLRRALERTSGRDLSELFAQWFHAPGYPELDVDWSWDAGKREVEVVVEQVQDFASGTPEVFRLPAEIEVRTSLGSTLQRVELDRRRQTLRLPADARPRWVRFDPRRWIPARVNEKRPLSTWLDLARSAPEAAARVDALEALGRALASSVDRAELAAVRALLVERLAEEEVAGVRAAAATALGRGGARCGAAAGEALATAAAGDASAAVRCAALRALGAWGTDAALADFGRAQFEAGYSWWTMGAAAGLVRTAEPDADAAYAWLAERLDRESPHDELRALLLLELAATGKPRALEVLRAFAADPSAGDRARVAAVRQLGARASRDTAVREELIDLLATPRIRLRQAVVDALGEIGGARVAQVLQDAYEHETDTRIRRRIEAIVRAERRHP